MYSIHCICSECGIETLKDRGMYDGWSFGVATFSKSVCEWCGEIRSCTEPRDYGYPDPPKQLSRMKIKILEGLLKLERQNRDEWTRIAEERLDLNKPTGGDDGNA